MKTIDAAAATAPFNRTYWVVPGQLLAGCYPGHQDPRKAGRKLSGLIDAGIRHVIRLIETDERNHSGCLFFPYDDLMDSIAQKKRARSPSTRFRLKTFRSQLSGKWQES